MKTPLSVSKIRSYLVYARWKYVLLIFLAVCGWNLIFTMTQYRPPEEKKVIVNMYVEGSEEALTTYMADINATLLPEMEEMQAIHTIADSTYGDMLFTTHIAAGEGDVFIISTDYFQRYSSAGLFIPLEQDEELIALLEANEIDYTKGWRTETETAQKHVFGIPGAQLPGLKQYVLIPDDCFVTVAVNNKNDENIMTFFRRFIEDMLVEPENYVPPINSLFLGGD